MAWRARQGSFRTLLVLIVLSWFALGMAAFFVHRIYRAAV
jgi:hypothetical protein